MSRDENKYPNPEMFIPERFLLKDGTLNDDKIPWIFGFGRRIWYVDANLALSFVPDMMHSPGRHIADATVWCAMVCILALFRIEKTEGSENVKWATGLSLCVTIHVVKKGAHADNFADIRFRSRVGLSRETRRWTPRSWHR